MSEYNVVFKKASELAPDLRLALQDLYLAYYEASSPQLFQSDLQAKDEVLLLYADDSLAGFSAFSCYPFNWRGRRIRALYSGDTVVERAHWGQQSLSLAWLNRIGMIAAEEPETPLYWFLLVKGHRTYRYLPLFAQRFFPHWEADEPELSALAAALAHDRFGPDYREPAGVVAFSASRGQLKKDVAEADERELSKPAVRYFLERNPGYRQGHELVCLCRLEADNLRSVGRQAFLRGYHEPR